MADISEAMGKMRKPLKAKCLLWISDCVCMDWVTEETMPNLLGYPNKWVVQRFISEHGYTGPAMASMLTGLSDTARAISPNQRIANPYITEFRWPNESLATYFDDSIFIAHNMALHPLLGWDKVANRYVEMDWRKSYTAADLMVEAESFLDGKDRYRDPLLRQIQSKIAIVHAVNTHSCVRESIQSSLRETDEVLGRVAKEILLVFTADHGEVCLGDSYWHPLDSTPEDNPEQFSVPLFILHEQLKPRTIANGRAIGLRQLISEAIREIGES